MMKVVRAWAEQKGQRAHGEAEVPALNRGAKLWPRGGFERGEVGEGMLAAGSAHFLRRPQTHAHSGAFRPAEEFAPMIVQKVEASFARLFAVWHPRHGRRNRWRDTARAAVRTAVNGGVGRAQDAEQ
jgi:hypothetical protein